MCIDLIKVKKLYLSGRTMKVQNVGSTLFWNDSLWGGGGRGGGGLFVSDYSFFMNCVKKTSQPKISILREVCLPSGDGCLISCVGGFRNR
jgi:hypothetical protein